jgi:hypothetical protein
MGSAIYLSSSVVLAAIGLLSAVNSLIFLLNSPQILELFVVTVLSESTAVEALPENLHLLL